MPEIPAEAVQAAIDGVDHEYVERCGFDHNAARAALTAAAPILAEQERADERRKVAEEIAADLRRAAEGRREYAKGAPAQAATILLHEADMLDAAARIAAGDRQAMAGLIPSWQHAGDPTKDAADLLDAIKGDLDV